MNHTKGLKSPEPAPCLSPWTRRAPGEVAAALRASRPTHPVPAPTGLSLRTQPCQMPQNPHGLSCLPPPLTGSEPLQACLHTCRDVAWTHHPRPLATILHQIAPHILRDVSSLSRPMVRPPLPTGPPISRGDDRPRMEAWWAMTAALEGL